jgi:hypothetical protein
MVNCIFAQHWLTLEVFFLIHIYDEKYLICDHGGAMNFLVVNFLPFCEKYFQNQLHRKVKKKISKNLPKTTTSTYYNMIFWVLKIFFYFHILNIAKFGKVLGLMITA